jgi:hypothetical protein
VFCKLPAGGNTIFKGIKMNLFRLTKIIIPTVLCLVTMAGCAGVGRRLEPPRVKLATIRLEEFNVLETVFEVGLRVFNTNDTALDADVEIPSYGTELVLMHVYASVLDIIKSAQGMQDQDQLKYHIKGKVRLGAGGFPALLPFESEGSITLPDLHEFKKGSPLSKTL